MTTLQTFNSTSLVAVGAYINAGDGEAPGTPSAIDKYTALVGQAPAIVMWYQDRNSGLPFPAAGMEAVRTRGATPMLSYNPDNMSPADIAAGKDDAYWIAFAKQAKAWGHRWYFRLAWEMNTTWVPYGTYRGVGYAPADFIAMWRHLHDLFARYAVDVKWVWCPNISYYGSVPLASMYPGDAYVDWTGMDGYNQGHINQWLWWTELLPLFLPTYMEILAFTQKPMMIGEFGCTEPSAGDLAAGYTKAAWYRNAFLRDLPLYLPRIRAIVAFDENKEEDWLENSDPDTLAVWSQVVQTPLYLGQLP